MQIRTVVLDMSYVHNIDTTGLTALKDLKADVEKFGGKETQIRLVCVSDRVRERFERFGWGLRDSEEGRGDGKKTLVYGNLEDAVFRRRGRAGEDDIEPVEVRVVGSEKEKA